MKVFTAVFTLISIYLFYKIIVHEARVPVNDHSQLHQLTGKIIFGGIIGFMCGVTVFGIYITVKLSIQFREIFDYGPLLGSALIGSGFLGMVLGSIVSLFGIKKQ